MCAESVLHASRYETNRAFEYDPANMWKRFKHVRNRKWHRRADKRAARSQGWGVERNIWRDGIWQLHQPDKEKSGREGEGADDSERQRTSMGGWGGLHWDARTQWHDTDAMCYCAKSQWEGKELRRGRRGGWARERLMLTFNSAATPGFTNWLIIITLIMFLMHVLHVRLSQTSH